MYNKFILSGFADEISPMLEDQLRGLEALKLKYFEIRGVDRKNISELTLKEAQEAYELIRFYDVNVSSIGSPIGKIGINDDFEEHKKLLKHIIKIAKIMQTKYIRIFSFFMPEGENPENYRDEVMRRMREMADIAEKEDVILLHENEKGIYGDIAVRCKDILDTVASPNLRAVFDPANFVQCGQVTYPDGFDMLKDYIEYMHIKDSLSDTTVVPAGEGEGKIKEILTVLQESNYRGFLSLEPHLAQFSGLGNLQTEELKSKFDGPAGLPTFKVAYDALVKILERI